MHIFPRRFSSIAHLGWRRQIPELKFKFVEGISRYRTHICYHTSIPTFSSFILFPRNFFPFFFVETNEVVAMDKKFKSIADQFLDSCGRITLPQLIDDVSARLLDRPFVSLPRDGVNLAREYRSFSYRKFVRAVNRTAWWIGRTMRRRSEDFETVQYEGAQLAGPLCGVFSPRRA